jgi:hypothetical protein
MDRRRLLSALAALAGSATSVAWPAIAAAGAAARFDRGLLWRIERQGVGYSYLFGTLHLPDTRLLPLPAPVDEAFGHCRRLVVEMLPNPAIAQRFAEAMQLPAGESLAALLREDQFEALAARLAPAGIDRAGVDRLRPWAALLQVSAAPPPADDARSLDTELFLRARFANRPVEELDTVEEQIAVFDDIPLASQLALLAAAIELHSLLAESAEQVLAAYRKRDLVAMRRAGRLLVGRRGELAEHQRILEKKVIADRSVVMAYRLQSYLRRGHTFAAIGASHLEGGDGVPALLAREYDWRVKRVW